MQSLTNTKKQKEREMHKTGQETDGRMSKHTLETGVIHSGQSVVYFCTGANSVGPLLSSAARYMLISFQGGSRERGEGCRGERGQKREEEGREDFEICEMNSCRSALKLHLESPSHRNVAEGV